VDDGEADAWALRILAFGNAVASARHARGLTQEDLAAAAGVHRTYIGQIESGRRNVTLRNIYRLSDALDLPPGSLLSDAKRAKTSRPRPR
jgi:transcriptional regulator with XRE-family HTH domain